MPPLNHFSRSALTLAITQILVLPVAQAATIAVDSAADDDSQCTLRDALVSINAETLQEGCVNSVVAEPFGTNDTIIVLTPDPSNETITLAGTELSITADTNVTIQGNGITVNGNNTSRVFSVVSANLSVDSMTITGGSVNAYGGGIAAFNSSISVSSSTVSGNTSLFGGGISGRAGRLTVTNSTISNNTVSDIRRLGGGGIGIYDGTQLELNNSTMSGNSANRRGGALSVYDSNATLRNSIVANSRGGGDCFLTGASSVVAGQDSIIEDGTCTTGAQAVDPRLEPLANNGGPTLTHALQQGSPALNAGDLTTCEEFDQRGQVRNDDDGACDIGAVETPTDEVDFFVIPLGNDRATVIPL